MSISRSCSHVSLGSCFTGSTVVTTTPSPQTAENLTVKVHQLINLCKPWKCLDSSIEIAVLKIYLAVRKSIWDPGQFCLSFPDCSSFREGQPRLINLGLFHGCWTTYPRSPRQTAMDQKYRGCINTPQLSQSLCRLAQPGNPTPPPMLLFSATLLKGSVESRSLLVLSLGCPC